MLISTVGSCQRLWRGMQMMTSPNMTVCCFFSLSANPDVQWHNLLFLSLPYTDSLLYVWHFCVSCSAVGKWAVEQLKENKVPGDKGLVLKSRAKHHAISAMLNKPFVFQDEPLVVQWVQTCTHTHTLSLVVQNILKKWLVKMFCRVLVAGMRWISRMVSTVVARTSNCCQTLATSIWLVHVLSFYLTPFMMCKVLM